MQQCKSSCLLETENETNLNIYNQIIFPIRKIIFGGKFNSKANVR